MMHNPTSARLPDSGVAALFATDARWQAWMDAEAALAEAQAEIGLIPAEAASVIAANAKLELFDRARLAEGFRQTGHTIVPLVWELARLCGEPAGGYVHWGATTENIVRTGDTLQLRKAHGIFLALLDETLAAAADLAERSADTVMAGRTHGQHAVPVTFGLKAAARLSAPCGPRRQVFRRVAERTADRRGERVDRLRVRGGIVTETAMQTSVGYENGQPYDTVRFFMSETMLAMRADTLETAPEAQVTKKGLAKVWKRTLISPYSRAARPASEGIETLEQYDDMD